MTSPWLLRLRSTPRTPQGWLVASFALAILAGTLALWLPVANRCQLSLLDALFTATSATCVTGLIVVDTGTDLTGFGQVVVLILIQAGGIGVMSFAAMAYALLRRRLNLQARAALGDALVQQEMAGEIGGLFRRVLVFVLVSEVVGAVIIATSLAPSHGLGHATYSAAFHAVSAFCNAGFSLYSDSLMGLRHDAPVVGAVMVLIVLGGIGHPVVVDAWRKRWWPGRGGTGHRLELNSRLALATSGVLLAAGAVLLAAAGMGLEVPTGERLAAAVFQSVTARTAGFNTIDIGRLPLFELWVLMALMFIGGSPGSCAGGIKTTTFALWLATLKSSLRGGKQVLLFDRHIPGTITRRALLIAGLALAWNVAGILVLLLTERSAVGLGLHEVAFEQISAFATVGLSAGLTPELSPAGKLWIIASMFVGRLGPLTVALWMVGTARPRVRYPEGRIMIG